MIQRLVDWFVLHGFAAVVILSVLADLALLVGR